ncbi:MAG TPA: NUDIX domain-containing protein, partial [Anaerolineae bacterium]|nr:NUDIX domain-containing protein [Anaerolineae bacterium]
METTTLHRLLVELKSKTRTTLNVGTSNVTSNDTEKTLTAWPPKIVVCVGTAVLHHNKILLIRQAQGTSLAGQWSVPWGVVEPGETPDEAALRETLEEGGITAVITGLLGQQNFTWENMTALIYLCRHVSGEPQDDGGQETDAAAYFSL